ncbi:MAG: DUF4465 domain-containing protein [Muribaculaceae bacterium]|nr:DUF4465 domain-containing protein [Muribaculaceae bacterium]
MIRIYSTILLAAAVSAQAAQPTVATFEDLDLAAESCWVGDPAKAENTFTSGSFTFSNLYNAEWGSWANFGYADFTSNVYPGGYSAEAQTINAVGGGHNSPAYGVAYCDFFYTAPVITLAESATVEGVWLTNTAWVVDAILNGDGMSTAFGEGDYLKLTLTGYAADESTKTADYYLADFRSADAAERYYVADWRWLDLSGLGEVVKITAAMETTKVNEWGPTTPLYFAFDDLGAPESSGVAEVADAPEVSVSVVDGVATVACSSMEFEVVAASIDGRCVSAAGINGEAVLTLPAPGVVILRVTTSKGSTTLKLFNK